jgi:hypothetical protein
VEVFALMADCPGVVEWNAALENSRKVSNGLANPRRKVVANLRSDFG